MLRLKIRMTILNILVDIQACLLLGPWKLRSFSLASKVDMGYPFGINLGGNCFHTIVVLKTFAMICIQELTCPLASPHRKGDAMEELAAKIQG